MGEFPKRVGKLSDQLGRFAELTGKKHDGSHQQQVAAKPDRSFPVVEPDHLRKFLASTGSDRHDAPAPSRPQSRANPLFQSVDRLPSSSHPEFSISGKAAQASVAHVGGDDLWRHAGVKHLGSRAVAHLVGGEAFDMELSGQAEPYLPHGLGGQLPHRSAATGCHPKSGVVIAPAHHVVQDRLERCVTGKENLLAPSLLTNDGSRTKFVRGQLEGLVHAGARRQEIKEQGSIAPPSQRRLRSHLSEVGQQAIKISGRNRARQQPRRAHRVDGEIELVPDRAIVTDSPLEATSKRRAGQLPRARAELALTLILLPEFDVSRFPIGRIRDADSIGEFGPVSERPLVCVESSLCPTPCDRREVIVDQVHHVIGTRRFNERSNVSLYSALCRVPRGKGGPGGPKDETGKPRICRLIRVRVYPSRLSEQGVGILRFPPQPHHLVEKVVGLVARSRHGLQSAFFDGAVHGPSSLSPSPLNLQESKQSDSRSPRSLWMLRSRIIWGILLVSSGIPSFLRASHKANDTRPPSQPGGGRTTRPRTRRYGVMDDTDRKVKGGWARVRSEMVADDEAAYEKARLLGELVDSYQKLLNTPSDEIAAGIEARIVFDRVLARACELCAPGAFRRG